MSRSASHALVIPKLEVHAYILVVFKRSTTQRTEVKHINHPSFEVLRTGRPRPPRSEYDELNLSQENGFYILGIVWVDTWVFCLRKSIE